MATLAFDVYGTLIDTTGVGLSLQVMVGEKSAQFTDLWRTKQLEYTWRYGLMGQYRNFRICTRQALDLCCEQLDCDLRETEKVALMEKYLELPAFDGVFAGLERLRTAGVPMYAFSNGVPEDLEKLLRNSQLYDFVDGIISVDDKQTFKPNPLVYQHCMDICGSGPDETWLISSNGFDVCGAVSVGMQAVWLQRNPAVIYDHWEFKPNHVVSSFSEMVDIFINKNQ